MKRSLLFYCILLLICCAKLQAQQYNFKNYSVKDGVAQSQVYSLLQDSRGYLWMGTRGGGLSRFDGVNFKTFTLKDGLCNNYVYCIKEDQKHNLWIGTNNGLSYYNGVSFKNYKTGGDSIQLWVLDLSIDHKNRVWLATNYGVLLLDKDSLINVSFLLNDKKSLINTICVDGQKIWVGTKKGLSVISENYGHFSQDKLYKSGKFISNPVNCLKLNTNGSLWIGTYSDGVYVHHKDSFYRYEPNPELNKESVFDIYFDNRNHALFATLGSGICEVNLATQQYNWLNESNGLSLNHVRSILQDKSGNYWFGTSGGGVCNYYAKQFTAFDKSAGLGGNYIYSIFRDSRKRLWIGNSDKGISLQDSGRFVSINATSGFVDAKVKAIAEDNNGLIYFGTDGAGLFEYNGSEFKMIPLFANKFIRAIVKDKTGNLFVATAGSGIYKINKSRNKPGISNLTTANGLMSNRISCLWVDKLNRVWYGTENNGIGVVIKDSVSEFKFGMKNGLPANAIRCFAEDKRGNLWIGTAGYGIASITLYEARLQAKKMEDKIPLSSSNIYLLLADEAGNLFAGSETGLDYIRLDQTANPLHIKHYSKGDGFTGIETCQNAVCKDNDGIIWFGTINGLMKYIPTTQFRNNNEPLTSISDVKLFYEPIAKTNWKAASGDWNQVENLELPYDQNHLSFDFQGINFSNPDAVSYQWKLEGFDKDWSPVSQLKSATYSNLAYGNYTFLVKACNEDGVWNKEPAKVAFRIHPPFWLRWWVICLFLILISAAIYAAFKYRVNLVQKKAKEQQQKIQLEKEVVELEQKALRLQMNPHFF